MTACSFDHVIIGNSSGAVGCIEAIRERVLDQSIAVISSEPHHVYGRPVISYWLGKEVSEAALKYRPDDFYERNGIITFLGRTVVKIDAPARCVILDDGNVLHYGKLLISTGGAPIMPPLAGADKQGVFQFNTLDDVRSINAWICPGMQTVVIGGGLTGLKAAEALIARGLEVTVVELMDRLMAQAADERVSTIVRGLFEERGCRFEFESTVAEIQGDGGNVEAAVISTDRMLPCRMLIVAIGVRPRLELLENTGIGVGRGIRVDSRMRTTDPCVYACGDVAEAYDFLLGESRVLPLLPNAYVGGRIAGINMSGGDRVYDWGTSANSVDFFGYPIASAGRLVPENGDETLVFDDGAREYRKVILTDGRLTGMLFAGRMDRVGILLGCMRKGTDVTAARDHLLDVPSSGIFLPDEQPVPVEALT